MCDRLVSYAGKKHNLTMRDTRLKADPREPDDLDVDVVDGKSFGKGANEKGRGPRDGCWLCGDSHYASRCTYKGKDRAELRPKEMAKEKEKAKQNHPSSALMKADALSPTSGRPSPNATLHVGNAIRGPMSRTAGNGRGLCFADTCVGRFCWTAQCFAWAARTRCETCRTWGP